MIKDNLLMIDVCKRFKQLGRCSRCKKYKTCKKYKKDNENECNT